MALIAGVAYDPAAEGNILTTSAVPMAALDTTNLRLNFTVPANGIVLVRMRGCIEGNTTFPQVLLGVLNGSTVVKRVAPKGKLGGTAVNSTMLHLWATFIVDGLTPGASLTWDAARSVEQQVGFTAIRWGGPNNTTLNDAFGAFSFEVWETE